MNFRLANIIPSVCAIVLTLAFTACTETPKYETCGGQPSCPPPADDKAGADIKKLREDIAGKWKFASLATRDTFHKTEKNYNTLRASLCVSYDGGIQFLRDYKEVLCAYCYDLNKASDTLRINIDKTGLSKYCEEQLQSGAITIRNDSLILQRRDSFIVKEIVYKRMNDDGTFKVKQ